MGVTARMRLVCPANMRLVLSRGNGDTELEEKRRSFLEIIPEDTNFALQSNWPGATVVPHLDSAFFSSSIF